MLNSGPEQRIISADDRQQDSVCSSIVKNGQVLLNLLGPWLCKFQSHLYSFPSVSSVFEHSYAWNLTPFSLVLINVFAKWKEYLSSSKNKRLMNELTGHHTCPFRCPAAESEGASWWLSIINSSLSQTFYLSYWNTNFQSHQLWNRFMNCWRMH